MKKFFLIVVLLCAACFCAKAQDHIILRDGSNISARITEVTPEYVKYKKMSNPNGPLYTTYLADIESIVYENGAVEEFPDARRPEVPAKPGSESEKPAVREETPEPFTEEEPYVYDNRSRIDYVEPGDVAYEDIRRAYEGRTYSPDYGDPFSPIGACIASLVVPGLGQCFDGEVGRGFAIFGGNIGFAALEALEVTGLVYSIANLSYGQYQKGTSGIVLSSSALALTALGQLAFYVWNVCDAVRIAEVKNMYYRDMRNRDYAFDMSFTPQLAFTPAPGNALQPVAGVSMRISF